MSRESAYMRVYAALQKQIIDGEYAVGQPLPTESALEERFGVSRTTVRRAMELLQREGFVEIKQGRGTHVLMRTPVQNLNAVTSIVDTLEQRGYYVHAKSTYIDLIDAQAKLAKELRLPIGGMIYRVQRVQMADDKPVAIIKNYIRADLTPNLIHHANDFKRLYEFLEDHYGICIDMAVDRITARSAGFSEAEMLDVPVGAALLYVARTCYQNNVPVCIDHVRLVGGQYDFEVVMHGRMKRS